MWSMNGATKTNFSPRIYNISQLADMLGVHRHTVRYWIKKKWVNFGKDYRNYPAFSEKDVEKIKKWRTTLRKP